MILILPYAWLKNMTPLKLINLPYDIDINILKYLPHLTDWKNYTEIKPYLLDYSNFWITLNKKFYFTFFDFIQLKWIAGVEKIPFPVFAKTFSLCHNLYVHQNFIKILIRRHFLSPYQKERLLYQYCVNNNIYMVEFCIGNGVSPLKLNDGISKTLLHANYHIRIIHILLTCGVDSNIQDKYGDTLLHCSNSIDIIHLLLHYGANPNLKNKNGNTPIHLHSQYGNTQIINLCLKYGGNIGIKNNNGKTALHFAEDLDTAKLLLSHPINIDETDKFGRTLLFEYTCSNNIDGIQMLLDYNANPNVKNNEKNLPLHCANTLSAVKILLPRTLNFDEQDNNGTTPLLKNVMCNNIEIVRHLLKNGANPNIENYEGHTPLHKAKTKKMKKLILKFLSK